MFYSETLRSGFGKSESEGMIIESIRNESFSIMQDLFNQTIISVCNSIHICARYIV